MTTRSISHSTCIKIGGHYNATQALRKLSKSSHKLIENFVHVATAQLKQYSNRMGLKNCYHKNFLPEINQ